MERVVNRKAHASVLELCEPFIASLRPHYAAKNLLVFLPLLLGADPLSAQNVLLLLGTFLAFCCCASAGYLLNDIIDVHSDRLHPIKKNRPIASRRLRLWHAKSLAVFLLGTGVLVGSLIQTELFLLLTSYAVLTLLYSLYLKYFVIVDLIVLTSCQLMRPIAGFIALGLSIEISWIWPFASTCLVLGSLKRYTDIRICRQSTEPFYGAIYSSRFNKLLMTTYTVFSILTCTFILFTLFDPAKTHLLLRTVLACLAGGLFVSLAFVASGPKPPKDFLEFLIKDPLVLNGIFLACTLILLITAI